MNEDKAREAFEARCSSYINCSRKNSGEYVDVFTESEWQEFKDGWTTALQWAASQQAAPEGWRLVPVEPTMEMRNRGAEVHDQRPSEVAGIYRAMLAAAPAQQAAEGWTCPKCGVERYGPLKACMQAECPTSTQGGADEQR